MSSVVAYVALGSNLGQRGTALDGAVTALRAAREVDVRRVSPWFETAPVGGPPGQGAYLNGVVELVTRLLPRELLELLLAIERDHGRERSVPDAPRTLDLDLLFYGDDRIDEVDLVVPHPRLEERSFVLQPLACLVPRRRLPGCRRTVRERVQELGTT